MQTEKVTSFPIVLVGTTYWSGLVAWIRDTVLADGKISARDLDMFELTDDIDEAIEVMVSARDRRVSDRPGGGTTPGDTDHPE